MLFGVDVGARTHPCLVFLLDLYMSLFFLLVVVFLDVHFVLKDLVVIEVVLSLPPFNVILFILLGVTAYLSIGGSVVGTWSWEYGVFLLLW